MRYRPVTANLALVLESHGPVFSWICFEGEGVEAFSVALRPADIRDLAAALAEKPDSWTSPDGLLEVRPGSESAITLVFSKPGHGLVPDIVRELVLRGEEAEKFRAVL